MASGNASCELHECALGEVYSRVFYACDEDDRSHHLGQMISGVGTVEFERFDPFDSTTVVWFQFFQPCTYAFVVQNSFVIFIKQCQVVGDPFRNSIPEQHTVISIWKIHLQLVSVHFTCFDACREGHVFRRYIGKKFCNPVGQAKFLVTQADLPHHRCLRDSVRPGCWWTRFLPGNAYPGGREGDDPSANDDMWPPRMPPKPDACQQDVQILLKSRIVGLEYTFCNLPSEIVTGVAWMENFRSFFVLTEYFDADNHFPLWTGQLIQTRVLEFL